MYRIGIYLPHQFAAMTASTLFDYFQMANYVSREKLFEPVFIAEHPSVTSYSGLTFQAQTTIPSDLDAFIVVGTGGTDQKSIWQNLENQSPFIEKQLLRLVQKKVWIATTCTASFYLAKCGLLNKKEATFTWWLLDEAKATFPQVRWNARKSLVSHGRLMTTGAGLTALELAKLLLTKFRLNSLERKIHRILLLPEKALEQHPYLPLTQQISNEFSQKMTELLNRDLQNSTPESLAKAAGFSPRTFIRHFKTQMKTTPGKWLQMKRLEQAKTLLMTKTLSIEEICYQVGYEDPSSFTRLFQREIGLSPGDFRSNFRK